MSGIVYPGGQWQPPVPSLVSLPVDKSKTEPKPAYYKLQFGDEVTGFSYYVRTLAVVVGRNCERSQQVPPPAITSPSVPPIPPLEKDTYNDEEHILHTTSPPLPPFSESYGILHTPPIADFPSPPVPPLSAALADATAIQEMDIEDMLRIDTASAPSAEPEVIPEIREDNASPVAAISEEVVSDAQRQSEPVEESAKEEDPAAIGDDPPLQPGDSTSAPPPSSQEDDRAVKIEHEATAPAQMDVDLDFIPKSEYAIDFDAPPPPPTKSSAPVDHVDVDLGPLKSVSRNHARIEYRHDLGQFCLEIYGRNGAWVDDRYYVKGSTVPLYQGSQIQIATRIFSFILPPSAEGSPAYSGGYGETGDMLDDVPWPYNLPPGEVKYAEFYGEPGPGPTSSANIAARVPPPFNAFAAADGFGLGIEGVDGKTWDDEWESDSGSDDDDSDDDDEEGEEEEWSYEEEGQENQTEGTSTKVKIKLKSGEARDEAGDPTGDGESDQEGEERKNGKASAAARRKGSIQESQAEDEGPKGGKGASKKKKTKKEDETENTAVEGTPTDQVDSGPATPAKSKKKKDEPGAGGTTKKEAKKKSKPNPSVEVKPALPPEPPAIAPVPTLAAAMAQLPLPPPPPPAPAVSAQAPPKPPVPTPQPVSAPPRPVAPATVPPIPPHLQRPAPTTPASPGSSTAGQSRAGSVTATGPPEPQKPFYLTELNETPGRPGHIIVNVPIPPSGAGPRPPPGPLIGLDGKPFIGPPPIKPTATFATIIHRALLYLPRGRGTLGEVCNWVAGEWEWFRLNIDAGWQNSIRHNLSLNKAFLKVPRIPEDDPESKGSVWIIDPEEGPLFEEKQRRDAQKSAGKEKNAEIKRERERQKIEERARKQREMALSEHAQAQAVVQTTQNPNRPVQARPLPGPGAVGSPAPIPPRPVPRPAPPPAISANAKGLLQPKAKITVSIQTLTPAHRAKSVISTTDAAGNPLPFACDGTTLMLDQATFGHLTGDIIDKLTLLGAAGAVDVLSAWVINKNKNQAARAAQQAAQATATANAKPTAATMKANLTAPRPNGTTTSSVSPSGTAPNIAPKITPKPVPAKPVGTPGKVLPGPAPPGASLTKVIGMIAEVANAKGDVNTVGPNASALLRYIRVVGVDIDLRVAEKIWATGVVPPLPKKGQPASTTAAPTAPKAGVNGTNGTASGTNASTNGGSAATTNTSVATPKPAVNNGTPAAPPAATTTPAPAVSAASKPVLAATTNASTVTPASSALKRKMEDEGGSVNDEAKKPKIEAAGA